MSTPENPERRTSSLKAQLVAALHDPAKLRIAMIALVLAAGYYFVCQPLEDRISKTSKRLDREMKITELAADATRLRDTYAQIAPRVPGQTDAKEWVQYLLNGIRRLPLQLRRFDCREPKPFGPLKVIAFQVDLEGTFFDLDKFLRWLETDKRFFRVDDISLSPLQGDSLTMRLTILGLSG
ncbi:MAG: hypothetical protein ABFC96_04755 [Thermoguttaceae bacterium]